MKCGWFCRVGRVFGGGRCSRAYAALHRERGREFGTGSVSRTRGIIYYQGDDVARSLVSTGGVWTRRDASGSDDAFFGTHPVRTEVSIRSARERTCTLDDNGFTLVSHVSTQLDFFDNAEVVSSYYDECEDLVRTVTGASKVLAFDHNVRAKQRKLAGDRLVGGSAIQEPLINYGVHNDYTITSAPARIRMLSEPLRTNDTLRARYEPSSPIDPKQVESLLRGRWAFYNVWRNVSRTPVEKFPLAMCDAQTMSTTDLVVFEIRYTDRVGENYFSRHSPKHRWYYFPRATREECVVLKVWDSHGRDFNAEPGAALAPATFTLHTGFEDLDTTPSAPDRESIEVRVAAFWESSRATGV